eukprot:358796-Chlamydomonas_euryale.AAC.22
MPRSHASAARGAHTAESPRRALLRRWYSGQSAYGATLPLAAPLPAPSSGMRAASERGAMTPSARRLSVRGGTRRRLGKRAYENAKTPVAGAAAGSGLGGGAPGTGAVTMGTRQARFSGPWAARGDDTGSARGVGFGEDSGGGAGTAEGLLGSGSGCGAASLACRAGVACRTVAGAGDPTFGDSGGGGGGTRDRGLGLFCVAGVAPLVLGLRSACSAVVLASGAEARRARFASFTPPPPSSTLGRAGGVAAAAFLLGAAMTDVAFEPAAAEPSVVEPSLPVAVLRSLAALPSESRFRTCRTSAVAWRLRRCTSSTLFASSTPWRHVCTIKAYRAIMCVRWT